MLPPSRRSEFTKIPTGDFIAGVIESVDYDMEHKFSFGGVEKVTAGVRFKLSLDGVEKIRSTGWMKFNYSDKSNLYIKWLANLVENATPDMEFDLDLLKGMKVKTLWKTNPNGWQSIVTTLPNPIKIFYKPKAPTPQPLPKEQYAEVAEVNEEEVPF